MKIRYLVLICLILGACQPTPTGNRRPTDIPFPTMTVGQSLSGRLTTPSFRADGVSLGNLATVSAVNNRVTPTPDTRACPAQNPATVLGDFPSGRIEAIETLLLFLNSGGTVERLTEGIIAWDAFGETGYVQDDVDLTGEGKPEILLGYIAPGDVGTLLIFGCQAGRYVQLFETIADGNAPPQLIAVANLNNNPPAEVAFARRQCSSAEFCEFQIQIVQWAFSVGRFVNLIPQQLTTLDIPVMRDIDNDSVQELVINLENNGTAETGPLRTGVNIYDWDGQYYVLSFIQLDPPRYHIQVIHEGDRAFSQLNMDEAIRAYTLALQNTDLRFWFNDGSVTDLSYAWYRLILAYAYQSNLEAILSSQTAMNTQFPLAEGQSADDLPVYVQMGNRFVDTLLITNNLHEACLDVLSIVAERDEALSLLNRYGSRSPSYTTLDLCPY